MVSLLLLINPGRKIGVCHAGGAGDEKRYSRISVVEPTGLGLV
jgi:hypothetical protein